VETLPWLSMLWGYIRTKCGRPFNKTSSPTDVTKSVRPPSTATRAKSPGTAPPMPLSGVVPGGLRPVGAGPTPALHVGAVGGEPLAVFSCCVGPVGAQNPIDCSITNYLANNTPRWANLRAYLDFRSTVREIMSSAWANGERPSPRAPVWTDLGSCNYNPSKGARLRPPQSFAIWSSGGADGSNTRYPGSCSSS
jgi:hypothetical protein